MKHIYSIPECGKQGTQHVRSRSNLHIVPPSRTLDKESRVSSKRPTGVQEGAGGRSKEVCVALLCWVACPVDPPPVPEHEAPENQTTTRVRQEDPEDTEQILHSQRLHTHRLAHWAIAQPAAARPGPRCRGRRHRSPEGLLATSLREPRLYGTSSLRVFPNRYYDIASNGKGRGAWQMQANTNNTCAALLCDVICPVGHPPCSHKPYCVLNQMPHGRGPGRHRTKITLAEVAHTCILHRASKGGLTITYGEL
jgi:hypothetical protein